MKILLISSNSSAHGGGERYLVYLSKALKDLGIAVHVLISDAPHMNNWNNEFEKLNIKVFRTSLKSLNQRKFRFISAILDIKQINKIKNICQSINPKAIIVNQQYDEDGLDYILGALKSKINNVIGIMHMPMTKNKNLRPFGKIRGLILNIWYWINNYKLVFVSSGSEKEFKDYYKYPRKTYVINNSAPNFGINRKNIDNKIPNLTFIGQFVNQKNLFVLINVWERLLNDGINTKLNLIGDGPLREQFLQRLNRYDSNSWFLSGWIEITEDIINEIDLFVMPSIFEGLPLTLIEVASTGICCAINPFNGAKDVNKYANWVHLSSSYSEKDFYLLVKKLLLTNEYKKQIEYNKIKSFQTYFSLNRMAEDIIDLIK